MFFAPGMTNEELADARSDLKAFLSSPETRRARAAEHTLHESLFGRGAYGTVLVEPAEVDAVPDARVRELRRAAASSRHVSIVAVGDTTPDTVVRLIEQSMPELPRSDIAPSGCAALPVSSSPAAIRIVDDRGAAQSVVSIGAVGVPAGDRDGPALDVLSAALGFSLSSRLSLKIRGEHGLSYNVEMSSRQWRGHGLVEVETSVETSRTADAIKTAHGMQ